MSSPLNGMKTQDPLCYAPALDKDPTVAELHNSLANFCSNSTEVRIRIQLERSEYGKL